MKTRIVLLAALSGALLAAHPAAAQSEKSAAEVKKDEDRAKFAGLDLGVGLSLTFDMGDRPRVEEAELINGIVRVTDENDTRARIMLESHYFFTPGGSFFGVEHKDWGVGPFVAIQPGTDDIIQAGALGLMMGFRRPGTSSSFNIGVGVVIDPDTQVLGDGLVKDQPLPAGETEIRYKEESQVGLVVLTSFTF